MLLKTTAKDIIEKTNGKRKGIDFKLYQFCDNDKDTQTTTVMNFLSSEYNPNPVDRRPKEDVDTLIGEALDKVLLSDRVRSCSDFYRVNTKSF